MNFAGMIDWVKRLFQSEEMRQLVWLVAELSWKLAQMETKD